MNFKDLLKKYWPTILAYISKAAAQQMTDKQISASIEIPLAKDAPVEKENSKPTAEPFLEGTIDWNNAECQITPHFKVKDAITLHAWNRLATDKDGLTEDGKIKLIVLCKKMEEIRAFLNCSINVHCMYRSQEYNKEVVKAIPNDVHAQFLACDFDCGTTHTIEEAHKLLEPVLEQYGVRMERNTPSWIHLDLHPVVNARYFNA